MFTKFSITPILSLTLAPPKITVNGLTGSFIAFSKCSNSFSIKKPIPFGKLLAIPTLEACAL